MKLDIVNSILYLTVMLMACTAGIIRSAKGGSSIRYLTAYLRCFFLTEVTIYVDLYQAPYIKPNHFVFGFGMMSSSLFLFAYLISISRSRFILILCTTAYFIFSVAYISNKMWRPETIMKIEYITSYEGIIVVVLLLFMRDIITRERVSSMEKPLWFSSCMVVYHAFAALLISMTFTPHMNDNEMIYFRYAANGLNITYYLTLGTLLLKLQPRTQKI